MYRAYLDSDSALGLRPTPHIGTETKNAEGAKHTARKGEAGEKQLLCGREIAKTAQPVFSFAAQMANYIYVIVCKKTRHAVLVRVGMLTHTHVPTYMNVTIHS